MTFVEEEIVETDTQGSDVMSRYSGDGRLIVDSGARRVTFDVHLGTGCARVVGDTHQDTVSPTDIPDNIRDYVLHIGHRIHGNEVGDGGFGLIAGDDQ